MELRLSEAFEVQREGMKPALECCATILNINSGYNRELMEKCRRLQEYADFIQKIRENLQNGMSLENAVEDAMEYCMKHGILADILRKGQMEVRNMLLKEYDEKAEREYIKKESWEEGLEQGLEQGIEQGIILGSFKTLASLVESGILSFDQAEEQIGDRKEEFVHWYQDEKSGKNSSGS